MGGQVQRRLRSRRGPREDLDHRLLPHHHGAIRLVDLDRAFSPNASGTSLSRRNENRAAGFAELAGAAAVLRTRRRPVVGRTMTTSSPSRRIVSPRRRAAATHRGRSPSVTIPNQIQDANHEHRGVGLTPVAREVSRFHEPGRPIERPRGVVAVLHLVGTVARRHREDHQETPSFGGHLGREVVDQPSAQTRASMIGVHRQPGDVRRGVEVANVGAEPDDPPVQLADPPRFGAHSFGALLPAELLSEVVRQAQDDRIARWPRRRVPAARTETSVMPARARRSRRPVRSDRHPSPGRGRPGSPRRCGPCAHAGRRRRASRLTAATNSSWVQS